MPSIFHDPAIELAVASQDRSRAKYAHSPPDIIRDALFVLTHDAVGVHRAIGALADAGWPGPGAALLRTLLDMNISAIAIVNSAQPAMAAFKYLYSGLRRHSRNQGLPAEARRQMRDQIRVRIKLLPDAQQREALLVVKDKDRPYWFSPEYSTPLAIAEKFGSADLGWTYAQLSGAAHGTFLGLRLYREQPDAISINPEARGARALSLDFVSCRFLSTLVGIRDSQENLGLKATIETFDDGLRTTALSKPAT